MNVSHDGNGYLRIQNADFDRAVIAMCSDKPPTREPRKAMYLDEILDYQLTDPEFDQSYLGLVEFRRGSCTPDILSRDSIPDLTDAATLGCLLALVREARQEPWYYPTAQVYGGQVLWLVERPVSERQTLHESEAGALVAALEAVP
jgi:hypothetical protein